MREPVYRERAIHMELAGKEPVERATRTHLREREELRALASSKERAYLALVNSERAVLKEVPTEAEKVNTELVRALKQPELKAQVVETSTLQTSQSALSLSFQPKLSLKTLVSVAVHQSSNLDSSSRNVSVLLQL